MTKAPAPPPGEEPTAKRRRGRYPSQFRKDAAAMVLDEHRTIAEVARDLGVNEQTLGNWVRRERIDRGEREGLTSAEREELTRLRRQLKQVTMERELAKRCLALVDPWRATSDPLPLGCSPGGRGVPSSSSVPSSEGLPPGVLRLAGTNPAWS